MTDELTIYRYSELAKEYEALNISSPRPSEWMFTKFKEAKERGEFIHLIYDGPGLYTDAMDTQIWRLTDVLSVPRKDGSLRKVRNRYGETDPIEAKPETQDVIITTNTFSLIEMDNGVTISGDTEAVKEHFKYFLNRKLEENATINVIEATPDLKEFLLELHKDIKELGKHETEWEWNR